MTLRKWFYLFWTTLGIGAAAAIVTGLTLQLTDQEVALGGKAIGFSFITMLLAGATISVLSQMGFFAYLIVRFIGMGMIRRKGTWDLLQIIIIVITLIDLVYLRYTADASAGNWGSYLILPLLLMGVSLLVSWYKVKLTKPSAWVPTLFFMFAVTAIEAIPALRLDSASSTIFMMVPLTACNAWQILILSKVLNTEKEPS